MNDLIRLLVAIAATDHRAAAALLDATPALATAGVARRDEFFLADRFAQVYEGDTALHAAAFSYDAEMARELVRRGAEPWAIDARVPSRPLLGVGADPRLTNDAGSTAADLAR